MRPRRRVTLSPVRWTVAGAATIALAAGLPAALAAFGDVDPQAQSAFTSAPDWVAPAASTTVIAKATGYLTGSVRQGGTYYVYANVADTGNPSSGISTVTADVSAITAGTTATALAAGSFSVGGVAYNRRSTPLTASNPLGAGATSYSVTATDVAGNSGTQTGFPGTVDNTAPGASDVQTANGGSTVGRAQPGDTITYTFSEAVDPESVLSGWTGASTSVVVHLIDGGCLLNLLVKICSADSFTVYDAANSALLPLGTVDLNRDDYHGGGLIGSAPDLTFGAGGTASTMVRSGSTIVITLGTASDTADTAGGNGTMSWAPSGTPYDAAGNTSSTSAAGESGSGDKEF